MNSILELLTRAADEKARKVLLALARRAGLLWPCRCDDDSTCDTDRCNRCGMSYGWICSDCQWDNTGAGPCGSCYRLSPLAVARQLEDPGGDSTYRYPVSAYAENALPFLGDGWGGDTGYIGSEGWIYTPSGRTILVAVESNFDDPDLIIRWRDEPGGLCRIVDLPDGAPSCRTELLALAERIADGVKDFVGQDRARAPEARWPGQPTASDRSSVPAADPTA